MSLQMKDHLFN